MAACTCTTGGGFKITKPADGSHVPLGTPVEVCVTPVGGDYCNFPPKAYEVTLDGGQSRMIAVDAKPLCTTFTEVGEGPHVADAFVIRGGKRAETSRVKFVVGHVRTFAHFREGRAERLGVDRDHPALAAVERHFIRLRGEVAVIAAHGGYAHFDGRAERHVRAVGRLRDLEPAARRARARGHEKRGEERDARARAPRNRFRKGN